MYYELYVDVLFLENLLLDYLLLVLLARLLKRPVRRLRLLTAASLGSLGLCLVYILSLEETWLGAALIYGILSTVMVKAGLGISRIRELGRAVFLLYIISLLLGGIFGLIQRKISFPLYPFFGITLVSYWILTAAMEWLMRYRSRAGKIFRVTISFQGKVIEVRGLLDTGNQLHDPMLHKPVSILTEELQEELCQDRETAFLPIAYHSIGKRDGTLEAFFADYMCIHIADKEKKLVSRPLLGITKEPLSSKNEYNMILHPDLFL